MEYTFKEFEKEVIGYHKIYIYGAGYFADIILRWITLKGMKERVKSIIVGDKSQNPSELLGIPVIEIVDLREEYIRDGVMVIALSEKNLPDVLYNIAKNISIPTIAVRDEFIQTAKNVIRDEFVEKLTEISEKGIKDIQILYNYFGYNRPGQDKYIMDFREKDIVLISPPDWDFHTIYSAIPCLQGVLKENGIRCVPLDLGIYTFHTRLKAHWRKYTKWILSYGYYKDKIKTFAENPYMSYEEYKKDMWFFQGKDFPFEEVKKDYFTFNKVQQAVIDKFYLSMIDRHTYLNESDPNEYMYTVDEELKTFDALDIIDTIFEYCLFPLLFSPPQIVGFSVTGLAQFLPACFLASLLKKINPNTKIIFGGWGSSIMYKEKCKEFKDNLFNYIDYLIDGEGETSLSKLCNNIMHMREDMKEAEINQIENLIYRKNGKIRENKKINEDVEKLPAPCFDGIDLSLYTLPHVVYPYQASRGCHYGYCAFCNFDNSYRHGYRAKSVKKVVKELLDMFHNNHMRYFNFVDEAIEPDYFFDLINEMDKHSEFKECKWFCYSRVSMKYTKEILSKAKNNGLEMMMFGIETFNNRLLKLVKKGISRETSLYTIKMCASCGIKPFVWLLCNFPTETEEEMREDIKTIRDNSGIIANINIAMFYLDEKCDMYENYKDYNIVARGKNGLEFLSVNNGKIIDNEEIKGIFRNEYLLLRDTYFISDCRFFTFFEKMEKKNGNQL